MIIILDGPDGTGKTTLAQELCKAFDARYLHLTYRWKDKIFDYHTAAMRFAARSKKPIVIDRWWPSEAVYAKAYRGGSEWPLQGRMCDRVAKKYGAMYIYCLPDSVEAAVAHHAKLKATREEMYEDISDVASLYLKLTGGESTHEDDGQYIDQLIRTGGVQWHDDVMTYTISEWGHCMDLFIERVAQRMDAYRGLQYQPALEYDNWNMLGHMNSAEYLIVGERVNPKFRELYWPFYDYGNSSLHLTQAMHKLNLDERLFMYCNAYDHDGKYNWMIDDLLDQANLKIITLGQIAENAMSKHNVHAPLPHPSWIKRFGKVDLVEVFKHAISK